MTEMILAAVTCFALYFGIRYQMLKRSIREINEDLSAIAERPEENRIMKLPMPQRELEDLERTLNHTLEEVRRERIAYERREREFQRQLEDISHDLRTPLTAIQGYLKLIDQENLDSEEREYLDVIRRRSSNLQHLISQFYEFSTLLSGDYKMELRQVDLARMCREQLLGSYQQLEDAGIEVMVRIPEKPVFILADENALSRIIGNLLQNAVRYAKSRLKIEITEIENANMSNDILLVCANDTAGLSEDAVQQMFERFYTGSQARNQGGTGLGLAISRQFVEQMGGTMTVESRRTEDGGIGKNDEKNDGMENGGWLVFKTIFKA